MSFKRLAVIFLFIGPLAYGTGEITEKKNLLLAQSSSSPAKALQKAKAQTAPAENKQAKGIIIKFHNWPGAEEKTSIENHLKKRGLKSVEELKQLNMWIFAWPKPDKIIKAEMACHSLSDFQSIKLCGPDHSVTTDEAETGDLKSCDIVSASFGLQSGQLSDYWAQRMIGSDLIKEELEQADPVGKAELVRVFDTRERNHYMKVSNLISDDGDHSVLPEVGNKVNVSITPFTSNILSETNRMLENAETVCTSDSEDEDTDESTDGGTDDNTDDDNTDDSNVGENTGDAGGSTASQGQEPETFTHGGTEYIRLHGWANNRNYEVGNVIGFLGRQSIQIEYIDNPYRAQLVAAGESYSPTLHSIPNTAANRAKLEEFVQARGTTVYNRNLTVVWKTATDWSTAWQSASGDQTPGDHYDLEADYEMDREQSRAIVARREYRYIFRPPVLDMRGATSISTDLFNWLPSIVLVASSNKLKIWGTREVGNGPLTINGVSVTLTEVPGTISDIPSSGKRHGRFEATLSSANYTQILSGGSSTSTDGNTNQDSSQLQQTSPPPVPDQGGSTTSGSPSAPVSDQEVPSTSGPKTRKKTTGTVTTKTGTTGKKESGTATGTTKPGTETSQAAQETVNQGGTEYIMLRVWANNRGLRIADVINFLNREGIRIFQVNNPQAATLIQMGQSYSPTVYAIPNTVNNRNKLEQFAQERGNSSQNSSQENPSLREFMFLLASGMGESGTRFLELSYKRK